MHRSISGDGCVLGLVIHLRGFSIGQARPSLAVMPALSPTSIQYDELKTLVQAASERDKSYKQNSAALQRAAEAEAAANAETEGLKILLKQVQAEAQAAAQASSQRRLKEKRAAEAAEAVAQQAAEAATKREVDREKERSREEVALLRQAAMDDVRAAHKAARSELDAAAQNWDAQEEAHREVARLRSAKHAARLREVIASEERSQAERLKLQRKLAAQAWSLGLRALRAERLARLRGVEVATLVEEVRELEEEAADSEAWRLQLVDESADAAAMAEEQLAVLREDLLAVAAKQKSWRKQLTQKHEKETEARVAQAVREAIARAEEEHQADLKAREVEHCNERARLACALAAAEAREAQHRSEVKAMSELLGETWD